jgi:hypothetical protein
MGGDRRRAIAGCLVALAAMLVLGTGATSAQTSPPPAASTAGSGGADLPRAVVAAMLAGTPDAFAELNRYLAAGGLTPAQIADRATALINALGQQAGALKPEDLARTMDRITVFASRLLANASVMKFAIDGSYRPPASSVALDFGPAGAPTQPGFAKVTPNDARLAGSHLAGLQRPLDQPLMASGISGIRKISLRVPQGDYRLVLMTQRAGDPALTESPFGRSLRVNGVPVLVRDPGPGKWIDGAVLTNRGAQLVGAGRTVGGFLAGRFHPEADGLIVRQQGGALVIDVRAANGTVEIEMSEFGDARSYVTGLLLEPKTRDSHLVLQGEAFQAILPLDTRLALEARVLAAAAAVLEQVTPAAGPNPNAPAPEFVAPDAVSSS